MSTPPHPADFLNDVLMPATGRSDGEIARLLGVSLPTFYTILTRERPISRSTAEMLGRLFSTGEQFWLQMQAEYDRAIAPQIIVDPQPAAGPVQPRLLSGFCDAPSVLPRGLVHDVVLDDEDDHADAPALGHAHRASPAELEAALSRK